MQKFPQTLFFIFLIFLVFAISCADSGGQTQDDPADEDDGDDDDDDNDDDSQGWIPDPDGPFLSNGYWNPSSVAQCQQTNWYSKLFFSVCDPQDDLGAGEVFVTLAGTEKPAFDFVVFWENLFIQEAPAGDCANPVQLFIGTSFTSKLGLNADWCVDVKGVDAAGNHSNMLTNLCVFVP